ncbi:TIM-barrel domain-containing protein [Umezawaea sp. Da 62-37]|uniref:TIM-barrel domain-containing protein n=1 Tax=Umezawaea sp. Da 62-37 TaxID=3075927 RepID=UPI0028F6C362|nr:TIM-barrel domain-containing protein [Umezawaea sp. Da 62-37]WNV85601.1 glycoside hydrolase family 31 protein [Umezawaea sp. Da 62-37]
MSPRQPTRRDFLKVAGMTVGTVAGVGAQVVPAGASAVETLTDYGSHSSDGRTLTATSTTGQHLTITAYGDHVVRVRAVRGGETPFADDRYEMVDPANHAGMGGTLRVVDGGDSLTITTAAADGVEIVLRKNPLRLEYRRGSDHTPLAGEDAAHSMSWNGSVVTQAFAPAASDERFVKGGHGLYGRAPRIDRTSEVVSHNYGARGDHADQAPAIVPLYLSSKGYAVFFNTTFDTAFSFGGGGGYEFSADGHGTTGAQPQIDYFVIEGPEFAKLLDRYTRLTGRPRFPRIGVFGLQLSDKNFPGVSDQNWWTTRITALRNAGFPFDVQVHDNRWRAGSGNWSGSWFEFSPVRWPDPAGFKKWADENGVLTTLDYNRNNSNEMAGWLAGPPPGYSFAAADLTGVSDSDAVPDWSNPATRAWLWRVFWTKALDPALGFPGDALWIDEPDEMGPIPYNALAANGQRWSELRNAFFYHCHKGIGQEGWDRAVGTTRRPSTFTRGATAGQQRHGHLWTGDIDSTYAEMREQIRGMQNSGLGGFPYSNIDAGGFFGGVLSGAFYRNWVAAWASTSPIWRPHSTGDTAALGTAASRWPIDQGAAERADFLKYSKVRYTSMPYVYTIAHAAHATGMPMARAMVVDHQHNANAYSHDLQYMWGPSIVVMPVTTDVDGAVQNVWLPAGETWYNFWSDARSTGSDTADKAYATRTGEIIMYVKAGSVLPRYKYAQSTAFLDKAQLEMDVYSGKDGSFTVYEDDGVTEEFRVGSAASTTELTYTDSARRVVIGHPVGTYRGAPTARRYVVRFRGLTAPVGMRVGGGAPLPAFTGESAAVLNGGGQVWDPARKILSVVTPVIAVVTGGGVAATVEPSGAAFPVPSDRTVHEAEDATLGGAVIDSRHAGYTGGGYVDCSNASGDFVEWAVTVPAAGTRALGFRYANGAATDRPLAISVDGTAVGTLSFPSTGSWTTWGTARLTAALPAGNPVRIRATTTGSNGANLDSLIIG